MSNRLIKIGFIAATLVIIVSFILVKPLVYHDNQYRVVIANTSEHTIKNVIISGPEINSGKIGPIMVGQIQHYIFNPAQDGVLRYTIVQNSQTLEGVINGDLKKGDTGDIFIVVGELYKVQIHDEYDTEFL